MTDDKKFVNPLDDENFSSGGGLWDDRVVTVTSSKFILDPMTYKDGSPVLRDGEPVIQKVWEVKGIADDTEQERRETYSIGGMIPSADGEYFTKADGSHGSLNKNCAAAKFAAALKAGGFPIADLFDPNTGRTIASRLVGHKIRFKGEDRTDKDGKVKKNDKGYALQDFYPVKYEGKGNLPAGAGTTSDTSDTTRTLAQETITTVLSEVDGKSASAAELVRLVSKKLAGNPAVGDVAQLIIDPTFAIPGVTRDGAKLSL